MRISDEELEFWGNCYRQHRLTRYLSFAAFIHAPRQHLKRIFASEFRPLLAKQEVVRKRMDKTTQCDLMPKLDELERLITARTRKAGVA